MKSKIHKQAKQTKTNVCKKIIYLTLLAILISVSTYAQSEIRTAKVISKISLGQKESVIILDNETQEIYKSALCDKDLYIVQESVILLIDSNSQKSLIRKIDGTSEIFCFKEKVKQPNIAELILNVEAVNKENDLFLKAYNSKYWKDKPLLTNVSNEVAIFEYSGNIVAVIFSEVSGKYYYTYIYNKSTDEFIEVMKLEKNQNINPNSNSPIANSPRINLVAFLSSGENNGSIFRSSWGSCMRDAMNQLYDDWDNDPVGTFTCWVTGPLCVIGGGIACGIKSWF